jgi:transcriptional regulator with XRE-family HTH domain
MSALRFQRENILLLSLQEVARRAGLSRVTLSAYERGRQVPRLGNYRRIAKAYNLPLQDIYIFFDERSDRGNAQLVEASEGISGAVDTRRKHNPISPADAPVGNPLRRASSV